MSTIASDTAVTWVLIPCIAVGLLFSVAMTMFARSIKITRADCDSDSEKMLVKGNEKVNEELKALGGYITDGAIAFLRQEYAYMAVFMVIFSIIMFFLLGSGGDWYHGLFAVIAFNWGCLTSILSGYLGMRIAVYANTRTAVSARDGLHPAFNAAFKSGAVMGFALTTLGLVNLYILVNIFGLHFTTFMTDHEVTKQMYECVAGYGLGGSSIALFGRVGGGIYTKAADVGADLCGKLEFDFEEDSPKNPATIADNVGDNVGDIAGMGADLFGSFAEASCATMVLAAQSDDLYQSWGALCLPMLIIGVGIVVCWVTSYVSTHLYKITADQDVEKSLKAQLYVSTFLMTPFIFLICHYFLPDSFTVPASGKNIVVYNWHMFIAITTGCWAGLGIGLVTERYTSHSYAPVIELADACKDGAAVNIIFGLALGYKSVIIPVFCLAITIYVSFSLAGMFGVASAAIGILSTMSTCLTIDAYGPIADNAGGVAVMAGMDPSIRRTTEVLDTAGNTTAAIGKGFAIGSAALVSLALFGAFVTTANLPSVNVLEPFPFAGLLIGAMLPYWFSALTMKSVGVAAKAMVREVRRQMEGPDGEQILSGEKAPDYAACVAISTEASLREMIPPGVLVICTPIIAGFLFGVECLAGVLAGALVSGVQMAISASNSGGAWDNAKKFIEKGGFGEEEKKGGKAHQAAVIGDTVGDPLKDTSGPALNILIKLTAIISLVLAPSFPSVEKGGLIEQLFRKWGA